MLSSILELNSNLSVPFGQLPIVKRFMKGICELRPALPRYKSIWDVSIVFNYFRKRPSAPDLNLKELTLKLTFLLSLRSGQRCQTIKSLTIDNVKLSSNKCIFKVIDKVKQTRVRTHIAPLVFLSHPGDDKLCIVAHLKEYIKRPANFEMAPNNYSLVMLNHINLPARILSPDGANQSWLLLVLMFRSLKAQHKSSICFFSRR